MNMCYARLSASFPTPAFTASAYCEGGGDVAGVVTPLVGGVAQAVHDDQVVELRVQLGVQEVEGKRRQGRTSGSRQGEATQGGAHMGDYGDVYDKTQDLSQ